MYLTTVNIRNGPVGYADTDYEYLYTEEAPTDELIAQFIRDNCSYYTYVRSIKYATRYSSE